MHELTPEQRTVSLRFAHVPLPAHVIDCDPWEQHKGAWKRLFTVKEWTYGNIVVSVAGEQSHHGDLSLWLHVSADDVSAAEDRRFLIDAIMEAEHILASLDGK